MHALNQGRICLQPLLFINRFSLPRTDDPFYNNFPFLFVSTNTCGWLNCELGECRERERVDHLNVNDPTTKLDQQLYKTLEDIEVYFILKVGITGRQA